MAAQTSGVKSTFRDLALALTEDERKTLLRRIHSALSLHRQPAGATQPSVLSKDRRLELIREEIAGLSLLDRFLFWFRRIVSTKSDEDTFIGYKLGRLRRRIRAAGFSVVEPHAISEHLAKEVWELYAAAYPLIPMYLDLWREGTYLQDCIEHLLAMRIPGARSGLYDFVTLEELQDTYLETERKHDVRELVLKRLDEYLSEIPDDVFDHLQQGLMPLYQYRGLCLFNYNQFFHAFGFDPGVVPPEETPPFREAPTSACIGHIEQLYGAVYAAIRLPKEAHVHTELLDRYLEIKEAETDPEAAAAAVAAEMEQRETPPAAQPAESEDAPEAIEEEQHREQARQNRQESLERLRAALRQLGHGSRRLDHCVPFVELVRYYRSDPYYKLLGHLPKIKLKDFYASYLTMRLLTQIDRGFRDIRSGVVKKLTRKLFGKEPPAFEYYRPSDGTGVDRLGLPVFRHTHSLNVMYNFLRFVYHGRMQEMVRILSRILPLRQRDASSELVVHVAGLEDVHDQIRAFDYSFSPDSDDGKTFVRMRFAVEKDATQHRAYRNMVTQRDREARQLLDRGLEHVAGLELAFTDIRRSLTDQLRERYASEDSLVSHLDGLDNLLDQELAKVSLFERLIKQVLAGEEGY